MVQKHLQKSIEQKDIEKSPMLEQLNKLVSN